MYKAQNSIWIYDLMRTNNKKRKKKQTNKNLKLKKIKILYQIIRKIFFKKRLKIWYTDKKEYTYWQKRKKETHPSTFFSIYMTKLIKANNKWSKRRKDRMLIRFIFAPFHISPSHPIIPNSISLSERFSILTLWSTSHFITLDQKLLSIMTRQEKMFEGFI